MAVSIEVVGVNQANKFLQKKTKDIKNAEHKGLNLAAIYVQGKVKESIAHGTNAPVTVDTGRFLNSVSIKVGKEDASIYTEIPYAKYLEYGTSRLTARPHFRNTKNKEQNKAISIIKDSIKKAT